MHVNTVHNSIGPKSIVKGTIFSKTIDFLADTGSQISIIPKRLLPQAILKQCKPPNVQYQAYNGSPIKIYGTFVGDVSLGPNQTTLTSCMFHISDDFTPIIGTCDLYRFGFFGIDPDKSQMFINGGLIDVQIAGGSEIRAKVNGVHPVVGGNNEPCMYSLSLPEHIKVGPKCEQVISLPVTSKVYPGTYVSHAWRLNNDIAVGGAINVVSSQHSKVHIPVVNHSETEKTIRRGTVLCSIKEAVTTTDDPCNVTTVNSVGKSCMNGRVRDILSEMKLNESAPVAITTRYKELVKKYNHVFALHGEELGLTNAASFEVNTGNIHPIASQPYKVPFGLRKEMDTIIDKHVREGIMEEVHSPWSAPCLLVKKSDGSYRLVCDYRRLNDATVFDTYPLPCIKDSLVSLAESKAYTCMDLLSGFHQIPCTEDAKRKLAISTYQGRQYTWSRMPMGPKNGPPTFQRLMDTIARGIGPDRLIIYLDDLLVHGVDYDHMLHNLEAILERLAKNGLRIKASKVYALQTEVNFAGYSISSGIVRPLKSRVADIVSLSAPMDSKGAQRCFGMFNFHRAFVHGFAEIAAPITKTYSNLRGRKFIWTVEAQLAMDKLKMLISDASLKLYIPDMERTHLVLETDASDRGIGGVLYYCMKNDPNHIHNHACLRPIEYYSKMLTQGKENMFIREKELFSFLYATQKYRMYLLGKQFTWRTDNSSISWARKVSPNKTKLTRWLSEIEPFQYTVQLTKSKDMPISDALSRTCMITITSEDRKYKLIKNYHESGHSSIAATVADLRKLYSWPCMEKDVRQFIQRCDHCQRMKPNLHPQRVPKEPTDTPIGPFKKIAIDLTGPFVVTSRHNRYIMVVVDHFTKRIYATPIKSKSGSEVAWELRKILLSMPEVPTKLVSDNGLEFCNSFMHDLLEEYSVQHIRTSPYYPQSNGLVERANCTIKSKVNVKMANWDAKLPEIIHSINRTAHNVTKVSPFQVETSHPGLNPVDPKRANFTVKNTMHEEVKRLMEVEKMSRTKVGGKIKPFDVGSLVLQKNAITLAKDGKTRFVGPYRVLKIINGGSSYKIEDIDSGASYVRQMIHLKQYYPPKELDLDSPKSESIKSTDFDDDEEFFQIRRFPNVMHELSSASSLADLDNLSCEELQQLGQQIGCGSLTGTQSRLQRQLSGYLDNNRDKCEPRGVVYLRKPCMGSLGLMENSYGIPMLSDAGGRKLALTEPDVAETM